MLKACELRVYLCNRGSRQAAETCYFHPYNLQKWLVADPLYERNSVFLCANHSLRLASFLAPILVLLFCIFTNYKSGDVVSQLEKGSCPH